MLDDWWKDAENVTTMKWEMKRQFTGFKRCVNKRPSVCTKRTRLLQYICMTYVNWIFSTKVYNWQFTTTRECLSTQRMDTLIRLRTCKSSQRKPYSLFRHQCAYIYKHVKGCKKVIMTQGKVKSYLYNNNPSILTKTYIHTTKYTKRVLDHGIWS